jgi:hypothetical protein
MWSSSVARSDEHDANENTIFHETIMAELMLNKALMSRQNLSATRVEWR